ncbi:MAG: hypothetical protein ACJ72N_24845 [Labedaea sp.]
MALPRRSQGDRRSVTYQPLSDSASVIEYLVAYSRLLAGGRRPFDETALRELSRRDVERARNPAAAQNRDAIPDDERSREPCPRSTCLPW